MSLFHVSFAEIFSSSMFCLLDSSLLLFMSDQYMLCTQHKEGICTHRKIPIHWVCFSCFFRPICLLICNTMSACIPERLCVGYLFFIQRFKFYFVNVPSMSIICFVVFAHFSRQQYLSLKKNAAAGIHNRQCLFLKERKNRWIHMCIHLHTVRPLCM